MARTSIKKIQFEALGKSSTFCCDRCGQYIKNVWTVNFDGGLTMHLGCDCFEKIWKGKGLTDFGKKQFKKLLKRIRTHKEGYDKWVNMTEEDYLASCAEAGLIAKYLDSDTSFYGMTFTEYRDWMLNEWYAQRFKEDEKELARFSKVKFESGESTA